MRRLRSACANTTRSALRSRGACGSVSARVALVGSAVLVTLGSTLGMPDAKADPAPIPTTPNSAPAPTVTPAAGSAQGPASAAQGGKTTSTDSQPTEDPNLGDPTPTVLQFGVGFSADTVVSAGPICSSVSTPCILGDGAGVVTSLGVVKGRAWYLGGKYELTRRDPGKLYRLATLQELRFEARRYQDTGKDVRAFAVGGLGLALYGDLWSVDTFGPEGLFGLGAELELSRKSVLLLSANYRVARFSAFNDTAGSSRQAGFTQFVGLQLTLEARDLF